MSTENIRNYMGYLWYQKEDNVYTIGITEEALEDFSEIEGIELPAENDAVEEDVVCGGIDTDQGPLDLYVPVSGSVIEVNTAVVEEPELIMEDPYEAWLIKIEVEEDLDEDEDEEEDEDDEDDEDEDWEDEEEE